MPQISIPATLFQQVEDTCASTVSPDEFVQEAVREKLASEQKRKEFQHLTADIRQAMLDKGRSEGEILADFESDREMPGE